MADQLLQEVDADLRAERIQQFWKTHRAKLIFLVVLLLVAAAGNSLWRNHRETQGGKWMLALTEAQTLYDQGKFPEAATGFAAVASDARGEVRTLAQLWQGRALSRAGDKPAAIAVLKDASLSRGIWGDLACLRLAGLDHAAAECLDDARDSPLAGKRREWSAAAAWSQGRTAEAVADFEELATSRDTPEPSRELINQWLASLRASNPSLDEKTEAADAE